MQSLGGRHHRGQSMTEFLVALAALVPLFLAVNYLGRYADIQQASTQASRYVAFQRAMQPNAARLPDARLQDQMRARFFARGNLRNDGRLRSDDTSNRMAGTDTPVLWRDLAMAPLLRNPTDVRMTLGTATMHSGLYATEMNLMVSSTGKNLGRATVGQVDVTLLNRIDLRENAANTLTMAAGTAAPGRSLSSAGSNDTRNAAATIVPTAMIPASLANVLSTVMTLFEPSGPEFGCIRPDAVPANRLQGGPRSPGACR